MLQTETLLQRNSTYQKLFELSPVALVANDMKTGAFIDMSSALPAMCGYTKEEFVKLSYWDITPLKYADAEEELLVSSVVLVLV